MSRTVRAAPIKRRKGKAQSCGRPGCRLCSARKLFGRYRQWQVGQVVEQEVLELAGWRPANLQGRF